MKKLISILALIFVCQTNNAQIVVNLSSKEFISSEIIFNDGSIVTGFIKDFTLPKTIEMQGTVFSSIESKINLDQKKFKFKKGINGIVENLDLADIKSITLMADDTVKYEKLKLKTINSNSEVVDLEQEVMVPLIKEGKINIYGLPVYVCYIYEKISECQLTYILVYLKKPNDEFAYIPVDYNRLNIFNISKAGDKFIKVLEEIGKDCPEFLDSLNNTKTIVNDENYKNEITQFQKTKKEKLKQVKGKKEKELLEDQLDSEFALKPYSTIIDLYSSKCK